MLSQGGDHTPQFPDSPCYAGVVINGVPYHSRAQLDLDAKLQSQFTHEEIVIDSSVGFSPLRSSFRKPPSPSKQL